MSPSLFKMPPAYVGQMVQYFHQKGGDPLAAVVQGMGSRNLKLGVWEPEHQGVTFFDGVRHVSDPDLQAIASSGYGVWDYCPSKEQVFNNALSTLALQLNELEATVKGLNYAIGILEAKIADLQILVSPPGQQRKK
jgi:hypothetical protein